MDSRAALAIGCVPAAQSAGEPGSTMTMGRVVGSLSFFGFTGHQWTIQKLLVAASS
jgi:hypothetical protein